MHPVNHNKNVCYTEPGDIVTQGVSWAAVAERVGTRSEKQCRSKWLNYLNWKQSGGTEWTKEDEINLILRFVSQIFGNKTCLDTVDSLIDFNFLECLMKSSLLWMEVTMSKVTLP